jgi:probable phosphoglycerate mutase
MNKRKIYIVRHGETEYNRLGIVQGSGVDKPLNSTGQKQAELFYEHYKHIPFDLVITSALQRTKQSVERFINNGLPHTVMPELNEISWGIFEGKPQNVNEKMFYHELIAQWDRGNFEAKIPGGESPAELLERQKKAAKSIIEKEDAEHILVCMHGRAMKIFLCLLLSKELSNMELFQHTNLCLYLLEYSQDGFSLLKSNDISHLQQ